MEPLSKEFNDNSFKHIAELYIDPEIKKRREANRIPPDFVLFAVQVIMNHDAPEPRERRKDCSPRREPWVSRH